MECVRERNERHLQKISILKIKIIIQFPRVMEKSVEASKEYPELLVSRERFKGSFWM